MSWINTYLKVAAAALALGAAGSAVAGTIVVRSSGPSARAYPPGKAVAGTQVALKAGDSLVVLDGRGTRTLTGPGNFTVGAGASGAAAPSAIGALLRNTGARQVRTGAVRGTGGTTTARATSLWYVDASKSGAFCLAETSRATLWRPGMTQPETLTLTRAADGKKVPLAFAAGQSLRPWPVAELPLADGAEYWVNGAGWAKPTKLQFTTLGSAQLPLDDLGAALIGKGCTAQLDLLVDTATTAQRSASAG